MLWYVMYFFIILLFVSILLYMRRIFDLIFLFVNFIGIGGVVVYFEEFCSGVMDMLRY